MASTINASTTLGLISSADTSGVLQLQTANTAAVTIDASQNVGVGTSSPQVQLHLQSDAPIIRLTDTSASTNAEIYCNSAAGSMYLRADQTNVATNSVIGFQIDGSDKMTIDSAGNLGLNVTPSAYSSETKAIDIGAYGVSIANTAGYQATYANNAYYNAGWKYKATGYQAALYTQNSGTHAWATAGSGTAGTAISFTQAMTLDANGLLQVGATSPINSGAVTFASTGGTYNQLELCDTRAYSSTPNSSLGFAVKYNSAGSYTNMAAIVGTKENATDGNYSGALLFYTSLNGSGSAERARILSSGEFLVSTTTSFGVGVTIFTPDSGGSYSNATSTAARNHWRFANANGAVGSIQTSGSLTLYNTTSDYRLKTVIGAVTGHGERIDALEPIEYEWKSDGARTRGFLAHKFQEMYPQSVSGEKDAVDADGNPVYQNMQASTSEVIADLVAEIQSLRQRLAVLEGK